MDALENIFGRRSVRKYKDKKITREELETVLKAGKHAPTSMNTQYRKFTVVEDEELLKELEEHIARILNREKYNIYGAKTFIIVSSPSDWLNAEVDTATAMQNMMLAAHAIGLGSCWINQLKRCLQDKEFKEFLEKIGIGKDRAIWGSLVLGYPDETPEAKERIEEVEYY